MLLDYQIKGNKRPGTPRSAPSKETNCSNTIWGTERVRLLNSPVVACLAIACLAIACLGLASVEPTVPWPSALPYVLGL